MTSDQPFPWDVRYAGETFLFGEAPNAFLVSQASRLPRDGRALAVADGEGRNGVWLAEQGLEVLSVDASIVAQRKAASLADRRGVRLQLECVDLDAWPFPEGEFDVVVGIFIQFAGPGLRDRMFDGMKRALKPGGLLLLEGYGQRQLEYRTGGPSVLENLYTEAMLMEAFGDMKVVELRSYDSDIEEGAGHSGRSALVDLVARKPV